MSLFSKVVLLDLTVLRILLQLFICNMWTKNNDFRSISRFVCAFVFVIQWEESSAMNKNEEHCFSISKTNFIVKRVRKKLNFEHGSIELNKFSKLIFFFNYLIFENAFLLSWKHFSLAITFFARALFSFCFTDFLFLEIKSSILFNKHKI